MINWLLFLFFSNALIAKDFGVSESALCLLSYVNFDSSNLVLKKIVPKAELKSVFQEILHNKEIPHCYWKGKCDFRAHMIAKILETKGIESEKIFVLPSYPEYLAVHLNRSGTMINNRAVETWGFHVAVLLKQINVEGKVEEMVLDTAFYKEPVLREVWENRMRSYDKQATFQIGSRFTLVPWGGHEETPTKWIKEEMTLTLNKFSSIDARSMQGAKYITLLGRWLDRLKVRDPKQFAVIQEALKNDIFREWWHHNTTGFDLERMANMGWSFWGTPYKDIDNELFKYGKEHLGTTFKVKYWQLAWKNIQEASRREQSLRSPENTSENAKRFREKLQKDFGFRNEWYHPDRGQILWREFE